MTGTDWGSPHPTLLGLPGQLPSCGHRPGPAREDFLEAVVVVVAEAAAT